MAIQKEYSMKKLVSFSIGLITILLLSACGSQSNSQAQSNDTTNSSNQTANDELTKINSSDDTSIERYQIIVLPTQVDTTILNTLPLSVDELSKTLTDSLTSALHETNRFDILESEDEIAYAEQNSNVMPTADFYLQSVLEQLKTEQTVQVLETTGQEVDEKVVSVTVVYQMIDAKSNKVIFSHPLRYQLKSTTNSESLSSTIGNTLEIMAQLVSNEIINEIYPIRLVSVTDNKEILLDYPLALGAQCDVFRLGKKVNHIYTDSLLGYQQSFVGKLQIIHSTSVVAYGEMLDGHAAKGDICKPIATRATTPAQIEQTPQDGVALPFEHSL